jgi:hypothetical protein
MRDNRSTSNHESVAQSAKKIAASQKASGLLTCGDFGRRMKSMIARDLALAGELAGELL